MKRSIKLYGTSILPAFIIFSLVPPFSLFQALINFIYSSIILYICSGFQHQLKWRSFYKKHILKTFLIGLAASLSGAVYLFVFGYICSSYSFPSRETNSIIYSFNKAIDGYTYFDEASIMFVISGIVFSAVCIFIAHFFIIFKMIKIKMRLRILFSVVLSVLTAPYVFLFPSEYLK